MVLLNTSGIGRVKYFSLSSCFFSAIKIRMSPQKLKEKALRYHEEGRKGKIAIAPTKSFATQEDLSLAYTPGVAEPCKAIAENELNSFRYTARGNLVAVISNGTAVLGLGNIGAAASKPVMEGKAVLFKKFADIDVFDLEVNETDPERFIQIVKSLEPTFGGINLEDIKAPDCFDIEERLKKEMKIPVFHDDQHGTAIITTAGLKNALEIAGKKASKVKVIFSGAGAAAIACAKMILQLGVRKENVFLVDSKGLVVKSRPNLEKVRGEFAQDGSEQSLRDVMNDADVFIGVSAKDLVTEDMVKSMAKDPIVFAMANPDPEIPYPKAKAARQDVIMATGRSDYPNQVNNVLGFPFIFRGALDTKATHITEEMKMAAANALADLAKEDVPPEVLKAYHLTELSFGPEYLIPKPLDPRVLYTVAPAVAQAAQDCGVARQSIDHMDGYIQELKDWSWKEFQIQVLEKAS